MSETLIPAQGPVDVLVSRQDCMNCAHKRCTFSGENRLPMYRGQNRAGVHCWIDPCSHFGQELLTANRQGDRRPAATDGEKGDEE